jgi:thioredoxin-dependent peroxiredoxin
MRKIVTLALAASLSAATVAMAQAPAPAPTSAGPQIGDKAPSFSLPGSDGKTYSLASFAGKKVVVLAWFPKAFTGG